MTTSQIVLAIVLFSGLVVVLIIIAASRHKKAATGELELIGAIGLVETRLEPEGSVMIRGELWRARSRAGATVDRGQKVRVVGASDYLVEVEPI
ncbi:MAG TPA: NfeD family protein [Pyrinomonadaceae bacterium]|nr:NfeD family protein [Pyrinomonadaceae bacterium]